MRIGSVVDTLMSFIYINKYHPFTIWSYIMSYDFMSSRSPECQARSPHRCLKLLSTMMLVYVDETFESHTY